MEINGCAITVLAIRGDSFCLSPSGVVAWPPGMNVGSAGHVKWGGPSLERREHMWRALLKAREKRVRSRGRRSASAVSRIAFGIGTVSPGRQECSGIVDLRRRRGARYHRRSVTTTTTTECDDGSGDRRDKMGRISSHARLDGGAARGNGAGKGYYRTE